MSLVVQKELQKSQRRQEVEIVTDIRPPRLNKLNIDSSIERPIILSGYCRQTNGLQESIEPLSTNQERVRNEN